MPVETTTLPREHTPVQSLPMPALSVPRRAARVAPRARSSRLAAIGRVLLALPKSWWMVLDSLIVIAGLHLGYSLFQSFDWGNWEQVRLWQAALVLSPTVIFAGLLLGLYEEETLANRSWIVARVLVTICLSVLFSGAIIGLVLYDALSRRTALTALACYATLGISVRLLAAHLIREFRPGILFVGETPDSSYMRTLMADPGMDRYGSLHHLPQEDGTVSDGNPLRRLDDVCRENDIREIVIHSDEFKNPRVLRAALDSLRDGRRVTDTVTFIEKTLHRVPVNFISAEWFLFADLQLYREEQATLKRICDVAVAAIGLLASVLLTPFIALAIKLTSRGPVFYSQDRVGQNGKIFRLYKFRTMTADAEEARILWSWSGDRRVTRVGRFLRRTRLDELPQLWNILCGHMSMVGPRPERPPFVDQLKDAIPFYDQRHLIKPGLTGWAQINYPYGNCVEDAKSKLEYDLYYMKHMSVELDLAILTRTALAVLKSGS